MSKSSIYFTGVLIISLTSPLSICFMPDQGKKVQLVTGVGKAAGAGEQKRDGDDW